MICSSWSADWRIGEQTTDRRLHWYSWHISDLQAGHHMKQINPDPLKSCLLSPLLSTQNNNSETEINITYSISFEISHHTLPLGPRKINDIHCKTFTLFRKILKIRFFLLDCLKITHYDSYFFSEVLHRLHSNRCKLFLDKWKNVTAVAPPPLLPDFVLN